MTGPVTTARMSGDLTEADRKAITGAGKNVKTAGYCILGGLVLVSIAEIVGHRNMTFKGDSFFNKYKQGRGR